MSMNLLSSIPSSIKQLGLVVALGLVLSTPTFGQSVNLALGTVVIEGTSGNDKATVRQGARDVVIVKLNGQVFRFPGEDVDRIEFSGLQGDDDFYNHSSLPATAFGDSGDDYLFASIGFAQFIGGSGEDVLVGGRERDHLYGGPDDDLIYGNGGNDLIFGDVLPRIRRGIEFIAFEMEEECEDEDECFQQGDDLIFAGAGNDSVWGNGGDDNIYAASGDDFVRGQSGNDRIFGSSGDDCLEGGDGDDFLNGGSGADQLAGGFDNDRLFGMSGADFLFGGNGLDQLNGGSGNDVTIQNGPNFCENEEQPE